MMSQQWFLFIHKDEQRLGPLSEESMIMVLLERGLDATQVSLSQRGWTEWRRLVDIPELNEKLLVAYADVPALPQIHQLAIEAPQQITEEPPEIVSKKVKLRAVAGGQVVPTTERRKSARQEMKFKVIFVCGQCTFRTFSKDISEHGLQIEHDLPSLFCREIVDVYIGSLVDASHIKFKAKLVEQAGQPRHIELKSQSENSQLLLLGWIAHYQTSKSRSKKKAA